MDYIQRYAYMVEEVIVCVYGLKVGSEKNVVLGMSMGCWWRVMRCATCSRQGIRTILNYTSATMSRTSCPMYLCLSSLW